MTFLLSANTIWLLSSSEDSSPKLFAGGTVVGEASGGLVGVFTSSSLTLVGVAAEFSAAAFFSSSALSALAGC